MLEWRLAHTQVINYNGDLMTPPDQPGGGNKKKTVIIGKSVAKAGKTIRGRDDDTSDEDDW